ncbi:MAG: TRAP transporter substrate-binding protein [Gammaproteobacteria bacterium]|nr:TRAP transporter substrate-binding protein [Gammaproteobacteria bacterium]
MKRREFVGGLAVAGLAGCARPESGCDSDTDRSSETFEWSCVTSWPPRFPGLGMAVENLAERLDGASGGRLQIKVYGGGELVPPFEVFDAVSRGTVEMGHGAAYYHKGKVDAAQFFTAIPFGLNYMELNAWIHYGGGLELWRELYAPYNLVPFLCGNTGVQMGGWFNKEINGVEDLKGLKMRIPGLGGDVLRRAGGTPVTLPGAEIFTSLQQGAIDATEWVGPYNDVSFGLHKAARYYYYPGWQEPGPGLECIINQQAWDSLPPDLRPGRSDLSVDNDRHGVRVHERQCEFPAATAGGPKCRVTCVSGRGAATLEIDHGRNRCRNDGIGPGRRKNRQSVLRLS